MGLVGLETIDTPEEKDEVYEYIEEHVAMTGSAVGKEMLENWGLTSESVVKVFPHDYKRVYWSAKKQPRKPPQLSRLV